MAGTKRKISEVEDVETQPIPSVKNLASSESKLRRQALLEILSHLQNRPPSSPLNLIQCEQLWRGFHVAVYMHDSKNAISVQNLLTTLSNTFETISSKDDASASTCNVKPQSQDDEDEFNGFDDNTDTAKNDQPGEIDKSWLTTYTIAFWTTIIREWPTIDSHRMDKYLLLVRLVTRSLLRICTHATSPDDNAASEKVKKPVQTSGSTSKSNEFETDLNVPRTGTRTVSQINLLCKYPMNPRDTKIPNGLRLHMLDIYVDELEKVVSEEEQTNKGSLVIFKTPLERLGKEAMDRNIRVRAKEEIELFESRIELAGM